MIYFDSDMSKTNTVVYFDWKTVIYIYVCRKCRTQFMLPMEKSHSPAHVRMRLYPIDKSLVCLQSERRRLYYNFNYIVVALNHLKNTFV